MKYDEKATVSIDADGNVLRCAKGAAPGECGFVKGAAICAKCGAMPVQMKMVPVMGEEEDMMEDDMPEDDEEMEMASPSKTKKMKKRSMKGAGKPSMMPMSEDDAEAMMDGEEDDDEMMDDEEMPSDQAKKMKMRGKSAPSKKKTKQMGAAMPGAMGMDEEEDDEEDMEQTEEAMDEAEEAMDDMEEMVDDEMEDEEDEEEMDEDEDMEDEEEMGAKAFSPLDPRWEKIRKSRIKSMGIKASDIGSLGYVCALERKAYPGSAPVCADCPGGCVAEKGMPGLLHVEGLAEKQFNGRVVDSGYSADADMFVVDIQTKDGFMKEIFIDGTTAEVMGFHKLDNAAYQSKSAYDGYKLVSFSEAAEIAVKSIDGHVVAVEPDVFEGFDAYAVEIEGFDGKSYDVFVGLDGELLGYDRYEMDEAEEIEAEAAELALKRAFSEDRRMELAKEGMALPDGSYPIVNESDLRNAIQAFGRAKDKEAAKRHIMKRARAMKLESLIPGNWMAGASEKTDIVTDDAGFMASLVEFQLLEDQLDEN